MDGITIRGARAGYLDATTGVPTVSGPNAYHAGAGIYMYHFHESEERPTISNCFIVDNSIGIALNSLGTGIGGNPPAFRQYIQSPLIVNDTIAWNGIGLYNGSFDDPALYVNAPAGSTYLRPALTPPITGNLNVGLNVPRIINTIFDSGTARSSIGSSYTPVNGLSCMEGTRWEDLQATNPGSAVFYDTNAWETGRCDLGATVAPWPAVTLTWPGFAPGLAGWPILVGGTYSPSVPQTPRVDIRPYTNSGGVPGPQRGSLYINDILWNVQTRLSNPPPLSENDFRLSPMVGTTPDGVGPANPLVDMGLTPRNPWGENVYGERSTQWLNGDIHFPCESYQIQGYPPPVVPLVLRHPPGLPAAFDTNGNPVAEPTTSEIAVYHAWDFDCEGHGNPRLAHSRYLPLWNNAQPSLMDIGADEFDDLIVAGFAPGTRIFARSSSAGGPMRDHTRVFFFSLLNAQTPANSFVAIGNSAAVLPVFNWRIGGLWPNSGQPIGPEYWWYAYARTSPYVPPLYPLNCGNFAAGQNYDYQGAVQLPVYRWLVHNIPADAGFSAPTEQWPLFHRSLECDIAPHLLGDPTPFWADLFLGRYYQSPFSSWTSQILFLPMVRDIHGSNSWAGSQHFEPQYAGGGFTGSYATVPTNDNYYLYYCTSGFPADRTGLNTRVITSGHPNAPCAAVANRGKYAPGAPGGFGGLLWLYQDCFGNETPPAANAGYWGGNVISQAPGTPVQPPSYQVNAWGFGQSTTWPTVPWITGLDWLGIRINLECYFWSNVATGQTNGEPAGYDRTSNMQTFLAIDGVVEPPIESVARAGEARTEPLHPSMLEASLRSNPARALESVTRTGLWLNGNR